MTEIKEVVRDLKFNFDWTSVLTPDKPYLYYNANNGKYHILQYWIVWFDGDKWVSSGWEDELPNIPYNCFEVYIGPNWCEDWQTRYCLVGLITVG